ncbi:MAG: F0F1 ATP synthase subunit alpha [Actinomycetota bacterium]
MEHGLADLPEGPTLGEIGRVELVGEGIAQVSGLPHVRSEEIVHLGRRGRGLAFNLDPERVGVVLVDAPDAVTAGMAVRRTGRVIDTAVGDVLLGRVVDPLGAPLDGRGTVHATERRPIERDAPSQFDRAPVSAPLQTGLKIIDALVPVGRGQRELIIGDRQTGKTAIALDTIVNQRDTGVVCVYCAIGARSTAVARVVADLRQHHALDHTIVVATTGEDLPGMQYIAPYAATAMAEYLMDRGQDVLVVFDDLTRHSRAYRELSLLLRRPPGREAYPGDIFYIHSRLLERATHLDDENGGGSLTALPIVETEAENLAAYIPTNLISMTDGQIYLSPRLFQQGVLPAVDVGRSVSRVGGKAQLSAYRAVTGRMRLAYSQFEELERFSRYGAHLEEERQRELDRGRRVREILKQGQFSPMPVPEQLATMLAVTEGLFDAMSLEEVPDAQHDISRAALRVDGFADAVTSGERLEGQLRSDVIAEMRTAVDGDGDED